MIHYLPVLLLSITTGMPDDAAVQPLPRGQVDYLSHDWAEEDVWRSWRNMTKQKNEIANGVRLENASWRTWWKQRNKLKTVSPETLNWCALKDSDVTWLYGPLHTAVDWTPPSKPPTPPTPPNGSTHKQSKDDAAALSPKGKGVTCISAMKPILKHRSITEMLTTALPVSSHWDEEGIVEDVEDADVGMDDDDVQSMHERRASFGGSGGRPPMFHTKSDSNILPRFGRGKKAKVSPPRVANQVADRQPESNLNASQRTGASNNLVEMAYSGTSDAQSSGKSEADSANLSPSATQLPAKKHISFNAIVEQCIAIDGGSGSMNASTRGGPWAGYDDG
ncbi:hypothetical protein DFH11DRAFT_1513861 [Phellopilus nigrolimitatus]|nr:hypothetical protein DFH11DRAFT_1513861 [Phellopilus nigrolimitatus]